MRHLIVVLSFVAATATAAVPEEPAGTITLQQAIDAALARNPDVAVSGLEIDARAERAGQQARPPNPAFVGTLENAGASSAARETTASVQQLVELGGDRGARARAAELSRDVARVDHATVRINVIGDVRRAFASVLAAQQQAEIARENIELAESATAAIRARVEAGKTSPIEETRASVALATERLELVRAEQRVEQARRALAATWGSNAPRFTSLSGRLDELPSVASLEVLRERLDRHPRLARYQTLIAEREAIVRLEEARAIPDLTASAGYRAFDRPSDNAFVGGVSIPLPLFDRNRAGIAEARIRAEQTREEARGVRVALTRALGDAHRAYDTARGEVAMLQSDVVPAAQSVYDAISEGYRLGKFGYLEVLDARRTLASARLQLARALEQLHLAAIEVDRLTTTDAGVTQ